MNISKINYETRVGVIAALVVGVSVMGVVASSPSAHAAGPSRYVVTTGSDTANDCSVPAAPCLTIGHAVSEATAGDTIEVAAGTYTETVNITKSVTLSGAQAGVDARTRSGSETIIKTPGGQDKTFSVKADDITIDGFTFDGSTGVNSLGIDAITPDAKNLTVTNNIFMNNKVGLDALYIDVSGLSVSKNLFSDNTTSGSSDGIFLGNISGSNIRITDNTFRNTDDGSAGVSAAIAMYGLAGAPIGDVEIANNSSTNDGTFLMLMSATDVAVTGNTVTKEKSTAIFVDRGVSGLSIKGNTLTDSATGIKFSGALLPSAPVTTNVTIDSNTITGMTTAGVLVLADSIGSSVNLIGNTIKGNAVGIDNQSGVMVIANGNDWGCVAGPGHPGCDDVDGNVTVATWIGQTVPGVPNTGSLPILSVVAAGAAALVAVTVGGTYILRKVRG